LIQNPKIEPFLEAGMYKKILVPLDGSKRAEAILPYVQALLEQNNQAKAILLQIVEPGKTFTINEVSYAEAFEVYDQATSDAEKYLTAVQERFEEKGLQAEIYIAHGSPVQGIINSAEHRDVDLIALASHGRTGIPRVFYGSVAAGVLHSVDRPLLLVRSNGHK
jgi:nucleotide-binding universal stress UspA family protein